MGAIENQRETNGHEESGTPRLPDIGGRGTLLWLVMLLVSGAVWFLLPALVNGVRPAEVSYSDFRDQVAAGNVAEVTVQGDRLEGTFIKPWVPAGTSPKGQSAPEQGITNFTTFVPQFGDDQLLRLMEDHGVDVTALPLQDSVWPAIFGLLPFLLLIGLAVFWFRSMRGQMQGVLSIGR
ncbi:MAG: ATP-dependent metallopeptidase FtsH/Yme1/Tma family protein, partial [Anaerolineae bacterium]